MKHAKLPFVAACAVVMLVLTAALALSQTGSIKGKVTDQKTGEALPFVNIVVKGTTVGAASDVSGNYEIRNIAAGTYTLVARLVGYEIAEVSGVTVAAGGSLTRNIAMTSAAVLISEMTVYGASRRAERITEAPAAISSVAPKDIQLNAGSGQLPRLLEAEPGVDIVQSGIQDFNINTRGFNSSLNRRLLVLMDGRDLAIAFLGSQEWNGLPVPLEDIGRLELVRGPGSALYGPNAFNGVINITMPSPKDVQGSKLSFSTGELGTLRADFRQAGVLNENWSYKGNIGRVQSDTWSRSRTATDKVNGKFEYPGLEIDPNGRPTAELRKLDPGDVTATYFSGRFDYTHEDQVASLEGGFTQVQNELFVTGIGRVQVTKAHKPWGRVNFSTPNLNVMLWGQGRNSVEPQFSLASGAPLIEKSAIFNGEVQYNFDLLQDAMKVILGVSHRTYSVDTDGTLMAEKHNDNTSGVFGQLEYAPTEWIKFVGAARFDRSSLHENQISPKGGIVWSPSPDHSLRATFNQAFQVPNYSEFFLRVAAGSADVPFFASPTNPKGTIAILARGNSALQVENVNGYEVGYKGIFFDKKVFFTVDGYLNDAKDFITDLLQAVNPAYPFNVPPGFPAGLIDTAKKAIPGLAVVDGKPAIVVSYTNAGKVREKGVEVGVNYYVNDEVLLTGNWTWYDFEVKEQKAGDKLLPNAPKHKFAAGFSWTRPDGIDMSITARNVQPFRWAAGVFEGEIPAYTLVNISGGWRINRNYRIGVTVSNVFDNRVYQLFGGSVIGRQAIATMTATF